MVENRFPWATWLAITYIILNSRCKICLISKQNGFVTILFNSSFSHCVYAYIFFLFSLLCCRKHSFRAFVILQINKSCTYIHTLTHSLTYSNAQRRTICTFTRAKIVCWPTINGRRNIFNTYINEIVNSVIVDCFLFLVFRIKSQSN